MSECLPSAQQRFGCHAVGVNPDAKIVTFSDGKQIRYQALVSTIPLDTTLSWLGRHEWADGLHHSSSHIVGVGIRGTCPHGSKCWLYFPENDCPFYRYAPCRRRQCLRVSSQRTACRWYERACAIGGPCLDSHIAPAAIDWQA